MSGDVPEGGQRVESVNSSAGHGLRAPMNADNCCRDPREVLGSIQRLSALCASVEELLLTGDYESGQSLATQLKLSCMIDYRFDRGEQFSSIRVLLPIDCPCSYLEGS